MGKGKAPEPPDLTQLAEASVESAEIFAEVSREQLAWARESGEWMQGVVEQTLGVQLPQMEQAFEMAMKDRQRYEEVFLPLEDDLIKEFQEYDTPERQQREAARRIADVRTQNEAQRRNMLARLEGYGIDPSQTRMAAIDANLRANEAAQGALAANQGVQSVEQMGRALRAEGINIGRGMPAQVAASQAMVNQTAGGAVGNAATGLNAQANAYNPAFQAGGLAMQGYGQGANIYSQGYQNSLNQWNANAQAQGALWGGIGSLVGTIGGSALLGRAAEGGQVPEDTVGQPPNNEDRYPTMLADDEFVIPADVVKRKGTEFFDKLLDKYKDGGEYEAKRAETQAGAQQRRALDYQTGVAAAAPMPRRGIPT